MYYGALANIGGELREDIVIKSKENSLICGLIHILTNPIIKSENNPQTDNAKLNYIPVLLKGRDIIRKHAHLLKKGKRVWLIGELKAVENVHITFENFGFENINGLVVIVHDKKRLEILRKNLGCSG